MILQNWHERIHSTDRNHLKITTQDKEPVSIITTLGQDQVTRGPPSTMKLH